MIVTEQSHRIIWPEPNELVDPWQAMRELVEEAGRTCYQSDPEGDPAKFVYNIVKRGHESVIEHGSITVRFITDRGVTHELVRHRLAAYSQESTRYCDYGGEDMVFIRPVWFKHPAEWYNTPGLKGVLRNELAWIATMRYIEEAYKDMRTQGDDGDPAWSPQQARTVLPNSLKTDIVMTANLREWRHVLNLRCAPSAHPQIRELMLPLLYELFDYLPEVFSTVYAKHAKGME